MKFRGKTNKALRVTALVTAAVTAAYALNVPAYANTSGDNSSAAYSWTNAAAGGGGYTTGIAVHPKEADLMYARSDVGGLFRYNAEEKSWKPLMNTFGYSERNGFGIDGVALDPNNPDVVYAAAGKELSGRGDVLKSTDRGETWDHTNLNKTFHANGPWRHTGEMIAVDPANSDIVYTGTRSEGLYKSTDGAASWSKVSGVPNGAVSKTYSYNFNDGKLPEGFDSAQFTVEDGKLKANGASSSFTLANVPDNSSFEFKIKALDGAYIPTFNLQFGSLDAGYFDNYYRYNGGKERFALKDRTSRIDLGEIWAEKPYNLTFMPKESEHTIKAVVKNSVHRMYIDGALIFEKEYTGGEQNSTVFSLREDAVSGVYIDDIVLKEFTGNLEDIGSTYSYNFDNGTLPEGFDSTMFTAENGKLRANGASSSFTLANVPDNNSFEFKIKALDDAYIPTFAMQFGGMAVKYFDNYYRYNGGSDKFSLSDRTTWTGIEDIWANSSKKVFLPKESEHTVKTVVEGTKHSLYIDGTLIFEKEYTGTKKNSVVFSLASDAVSGVYVDDVVLKSLAVQTDNSTYSYNFDDGTLPEGFDSTMFTAENGKLKANGASSYFTLANVPENNSLEFKIKALDDAYVPIFTLQFGGLAAAYADNCYHYSGKDVIKLSDRKSWTAIKEIWAEKPFNNTFLPKESEHTVKAIVKGTTHSLYIDDTLIFEEEYTGEKQNSIVFSLSKNAVSGVYIDDIVLNGIEDDSVQFDSPVGIRSVVFDPTSGESGVSQTIYASVAGKGIYMTNDAGASWTLMDGSPSLAARMEAAADGTLYVTTLGQGVKKYSNGEWTDITPSDADLRYCGLSVDLNDTNNIIVSRWANADNPNELPVYRSKDKGESWEEVTVTTEKNRKGAPSWYPDWFFMSAVSQVVFDPHRPGQVFAADWYSVWRTPDIWAEPAGNTRWYAMCDGLENTCILSIAAPHTGAKLFSGGADFGGHRYMDTTGVSDGNLIQIMGNVNSIDYCEADPNYMAVTGSKFHDASGVFALSQDNGKTFEKVTVNDTSRNGRVAYSATDTNKIVWVPQGEAPMVTFDRGATWQASSGAPSDAVTNFWLTNQPLAADKVNGNTFYLMCPSNGSGTPTYFYRSTDGGLNWSAVNTTDLPDSVQWDYPQIKAAPGMEGEVWTAQGRNGLYRSGNGGDTFTKVENVQTARLVAFGKNPPGKSHPAVFVQGTVNNIEDGVFRSDDMGETWIRINDSNSKIGNIPNSMEGDRQVFGRVYIGTNGSGVYCGEAVSNAVWHDDFSSEENGMLLLGSGESLSRENVPKNLSAEFDVKSAAGGNGRLYADVRRTDGKAYRITYENSSFKVERLENESLTELSSVASNALSAAQSMRIKYTVFEDRIGIYVNGKLIKTVIAEEMNKLSAPFGLSLVNDGDGVYIDNLKINKADAADCEELYENVFLSEDFSGEKPWYANDNCQLYGGALKILNNGKIASSYIPKDSDIEYDFSFGTNGEITSDDAKKVTTMEWSVRKTNDSNYYYMINVRYSPYNETINVQVSGRNNGVYEWVGEKTVPSTSEGRLCISCNGNKMAVKLNGKAVYEWIDNLDYPEGEKLSLSERTWSDFTDKAYIIMDNYKISSNTAESELGMFINEMSFHRNGGGIIGNSSTLTDGSYVLKTSINNLSAESRTADICIGIYQNGALTALSVTPVTAEAGTYNKVIEVPFTFDSTGIADGAAVSLKGFMLENMDNIKPMTAAAAVNGLTVPIQ